MTIPTPPSDYHHHQGEALGLLHAAKPTNADQQFAAANVHSTLALAAVLEAWRLEWNEPVSVELVETPDQTTLAIRILDDLVKVLGRAGHHITQDEGEDGLADELLDAIVRHLPAAAVVHAPGAGNGAGEPLAEWERELLEHPDHPVANLEDLRGLFELGEPWVCVRDTAHRPWIVVTDEDGDMIAISHDPDPDTDVDVELPARVDASALTYPLAWLR